MTEVAIVGAGPVGLSMALALATYGVPSTVLEAAPRHGGEGSRSICVQQHTLEIFGRIGVGKRMTDEGLPWSVARTYVRDTELSPVALGESAAEELPPYINLPQWRVEEILLEAAQSHPLVHLRWGTAVQELRQHEERVFLDTTRGRVAAEYVVGCDGAHSSVRAGIGVGFPGRTLDDRLLIVDVRAAVPWPAERRVIFEPRGNRGRQVFVHAQPDGVWRIDWQVARDADVDVETRVRAIVGEAPYEVVWQSAYPFAQRLADRFRAHRVFLAGDAAHVISPIGAHGVNSGVQDAWNLAWKLRLVLDDLAPDALLDTYHAERRAAAEENLARTEATLRFMAPATPLRRLVRAAVLRGAPWFPALRRQVDAGALSAPAVYDGSPIVRPGAGMLAPPELRVEMGRGFLAAASETLAHARAAAPTRLLEVDGPAGLTLVRPDGHLAAVGSAEDVTSLVDVATART